MRLSRLLAAVLAVLCAVPAWAGGVLDRVRAENMVRCGARERPGFASAGADGRVAGLAVDLCRAVAVAVLGPDGRVVFRLDASPLDDISFLSGSEIEEGSLAASVIPGPTVFIEALTLMVPEASAVHRLEDLAGATVCFLSGSAAQRALEAAAEARGVGFARIGFQEEGEMQDAYNVQRCRAVAGEATGLAAMRLDGGVNHLASRILPEPLALYPVIAATSTGDGQWAALVGWVVDALVLADAPRSRWAGNAFPLSAMPALRERWREDVRTALGTYGDMVQRNLGAGSPLQLAPGSNAPWPAGLLMPPFVE